MSPAVASMMLSVLLWVLASAASAQTTPPPPPPTLLVIGDSLTAAYGLASEDGLPAQLERALTARGLAVRVRDGGVSGDTSTGGRARLAWMLGSTPDRQPDAVIVELGANDALRGVDPAITEANLAAILAELKARDLLVLLAGMRAPPNMGEDYRQRFDAIYPRLAREYGVSLYPFFLEGVAAVPALNQADGIHPNARGVAEIVRRITPSVIALLGQVRASGGGTSAQGRSVALPPTRGGGVAPQAPGGGGSAQEVEQHGGEHDDGGGE